MLITKLTLRWYGTAFLAKSDPDRRSLSILTRRRCQLLRWKILVCMSEQLRNLFWRNLVYRYISTIEGELDLKLSWEACNETLFKAKIAPRSFIDRVSFHNYGKDKIMISYYDIVTTTDYVKIANCRHPACPVRLHTCRKLKVASKCRNGL